MRLMAAGLVLASLMAGTAFGADKAAPAPEAAPLLTPPGVILNGTRTGVIYANAKGLSLYTFDMDKEPGKSACGAGECIDNWPALKAPDDAKPFGDWSVITRDDGSKQWALHGKPLYTFVKDTKLGDVNGNNVANVWKLATYRAGAGVAVPDGIKAADVAKAGGPALVDHRGHTLYFFDGDLKADRVTCAGPCINQWIPLPAAELANPVGDFQVISRPDGTKQWSYKGKPLYTYAADLNPSEVNGFGVDKNWRPALLARAFVPAEVQVRHDPDRGVILANAQGKTLYLRDRFRYGVGGHNTPNSTPIPQLGRTMGTKTCDAECVKEWPPLVAPEGAEPSGLWGIVERDDKTRQWAYNGYPLYAFTGDGKPGDTLGHDRFTYMDGANALYWRTARP